MKGFFTRAQDPVSCGTHAIGAMAALAGAGVYVLRALLTGSSGPAVAGAMCFCLSMIALYSASAVYHFYPGDVNTKGVKEYLRKLDHGMIYVLIAGSYTPFSLLLLPQPKGLHFSLALWGVAIAGIVMKVVWIREPRVLSTLVYLAMGWAVVFAWSDFMTMEPLCLALVAAGGGCYTLGAVFYAIQKPNINAAWTFHELFHLLILAGSLSHYIAVFVYCL